MARPCPHPDESLPVAGVPKEPGDCPVCWHWVNTSSVRAKWESRTAARPKVQPVRIELPCKFLGDEISGYEKRMLSLGTYQRWARCAKGFTLNPRDVPGIVCPCRGCHSRCAGYEPEEQA